MDAANLVMCEFLPMRYRCYHHMDRYIKYKKKILKSEEMCYETRSLMNPFTSRRVPSNSVAALTLRMFAGITSFEDQREEAMYRAMCNNVPEKFYNVSVEVMLERRYFWRKTYFERENVIKHPFCGAKLLTKSSVKATVWDMAFGTESWYLRSNAYANGAVYYTMMFSEYRLTTRNFHNRVTVPLRVIGLSERWDADASRFSYSSQGAYHDVTPAFNDRIFKYSRDTDATRFVITRQFSEQVYTYVRTQDYLSRLLQQLDDNRHIPVFKVKQCDDDSTFLQMVRYVTSDKYGGNGLHCAPEEVRSVIQGYVNGDGTRFRTDSGCVVCLDESCEYVTMLPCAHSVTCPTCSPECQRCPVCRKPVVIMVHECN